MSYWNTKIALAAFGAAGALLGCHYSAALLATILCVSIAEQIGELRARQYFRHNTLTGHCRSCS